MTFDIDIAIVGGGIVGLWTGVHLLDRFPGMSVAIWEQEEFLGEHSSGRNSEVLHSGVYYKNGSLKHELCIQGNQLWRKFINESQIDHRFCGKWIVANSSQVDQLERIFQNGELNGVPGIRRATEDEIKRISQEVNCDKAIFCPTSGVVDSAGAIRKLANLFCLKGGILQQPVKVSKLTNLKNGFQFYAGSDSITAHRIINCAGHFAVGLRQSLGLQNLKNRRVKGHYLSLKKPLSLDRLVYPIPPQHGLGLGVHLTIDVSGAQKFGPNTEEVEEINYSTSDQVIEEMFPSIQDLFPHVQKHQLALSYTGIRSKIVDMQNQTEADFIIQGPKTVGIPGYFEFLGIESPGLTAAPALAEKMIDLVKESET